MSRVHVMLTGGSGFIGSHTLLDLLSNGYECIVVDNLINSSQRCLDNISEYLGKPIRFCNTDLLDFEAVCKIFEQNQIAAVIHFAGLKSVGESVENPLLYYNVNVVGTINLLRAMQKFNVNKIVFSSSATIYGQPKYLPIDESHPVGDCLNPYGRTKYFIELMIKDWAETNNCSFIHLRYFNPVGASESGVIGESPLDVPTNLFPYISSVAIGKLPYLKVFGNDYQTVDGTGVRDYIHVVDLAKAHTKALEFLIKSPDLLRKVYNVGTGQGLSVLQIVDEYQKACGKKINVKFVERRPGDAAIVFADNKLVKSELHWCPEYDVKHMCEHSWNWIRKLNQ